MKATAVSSNVKSLREGAAAAAVTDRLGTKGHQRGRGELVDLTPRQIEVLRLLGEGLPTKLICRRLNIAPGTVKVHIRLLMRKLGVSSRLQAVVAAHRCGLLGDSGDNGPVASGSPSGGHTKLADDGGDHETSRAVALSV